MISLNSVFKVPFLDLPGGTSRRSRGTYNVKTSDLKVGLFNEVAMISVAPVSPRYIGKGCFEVFKVAFLH